MGLFAFLWRGVAFLLVAASVSGSVRASSRSAAAAAAAAALDAQIQETSVLAAAARQQALEFAAAHADLVQRRAALGGGASARGASAVSASAASAAASGAAASASAATGFVNGNGVDFYQRFGRWYMEDGAWNYGSSDKLLECGICVQVVTALIHRLGAQISRLAIQSESARLCPTLPWYMKSGCDFVCRKSEKIVEDSVMKLLEPLPICKQLTMCPPEPEELAYLAGWNEYGYGASAAISGGVLSAPSMETTSGHTPYKWGSATAYAPARPGALPAGYGTIASPGMAPPSFPGPFGIPIQKMYGGGNTEYNPLSGYTSPIYGPIFSQTGAKIAGAAPAGAVAAAPAAAAAAPAAGAAAPAAAAPDAAAAAPAAS